MKITLYTDIYAGIEPENVCFSQQELPYKADNTRRFKVIVNLPDITEVDHTVEAVSVVEVENDQ